MKKTVMSLFIASMVASGSAMAATNDSSSTQLNFNGKVTSSLCQINTADTAGIDINLGEVQATALANGTSKPQSFTVNLENCDPTVNSIKYQITSKNQGDSNYISPDAGDTSATNVGVFLTTADASGANPITLGDEQTATVINGIGGNAAPNQKIELQAYMKKVGAKDVTAGNVNAVGFITVKAAVTPPGP
ncbi:TPA: type 1 fimbrial protein [Escherichia coli]|nr:type 1 fimbrial protein [Escherichia coli]